MAPAPLHDEALLTRFRALGDLLEARRAIWEPAPFMGLPAGWEELHPEVARWVQSLPEAEVDRLELNIEEAVTTPGAPAALLGWLDELGTLCEIGAHPRQPLPAPLNPHQIHARKAAQITGFIEAVLPSLPEAGPIVDWCAGKGHLGRSLGAASGLGTVALEIDGALVASGAALAAAVGARSCAFIQGDATTPAAREALSGANGAVALHACGHLSDHLMSGAAERGLGFLAVAPCCYWRLGGAEVYRPRSSWGQAADLRLDLSRLRLACLEERTGPPRTFAARRRRMAWRLGLDLLTRQVTGRTRYHTPPEGFRDLLDLPFGDFCRAVSLRLGVELPPVWDEAEAEAAGWAEVLRVRAHGLVRAPFRRALELWLVLDRALALREAGYGVRVGTFCPDTLTPRNLLIVARRPG